MTTIPFPPYRDPEPSTSTEPMPVALGVACGVFWFPLVGCWAYILGSLGHALYFGFAFELLEFAIHVLIYSFGGLIFGLLIFFPGLVLALILDTFGGLLVRSMQIEMSPLSGACHVGAWTAMLPMLLLYRTPYAPYYGMELIVPLLGLAIATPLFQYAAAWSQCPTFEPPDSTRFWQFGIRQLLVLTIWLAAGLTAMKLLGLLQGAVLAFLAAWLVYQWCTRKLVCWFCRWRSHRRWGTPLPWQ